MAEKILEIKKITKSFSREIKSTEGINHAELYYVLKDLSFNIRKGRITALMGGNGTGKTTLFNIISRFLDPDYGSIKYKNEVIINYPQLDSEKYKGQKQSKVNSKKKQKPSYFVPRLGIGRMFQDTHIFPQLSIMDNMLIADSDFFGEIPGTSIFYNSQYQKKEKERVDKAKSIFGKLFDKSDEIRNDYDKLAGNLSYGQQKLLALLRLFMGDYELFLLDEPTAGVNPEVIKKFLIIVKHITQELGKTVFLIEHNMQFVQDAADWCVFLERDSEGFPLEGTPNNIIENEYVRIKYLGY